MSGALGSERSEQADLFPELIAFQVMRKLELKTGCIAMILCDILAFRFGPSASLKQVL